MTIFRADKNEHAYKRVCMNFSADSRLSWEARGVMSYLLGKPDDWHIIAEDLINQTKAGRDKVYRILDELQAAGYLQRVHERDANGRVQRVSYTLLEVSPLPANTEVVQLPDLPLPAKPLPANPTLLKVDHDLKTLPTGEAPPVSVAPQPERTRPPERPARTNPHPVALTPPPLPTGTPTPAVAGQVPAEIAQPRLVDADMPDPVDVYREVCKVQKPNQVQRDTIRAAVTAYPDEWRKVCAHWMLNSWNVRKVENLLDAYRKAVIERRKVEARDAETRRARAALVPDEPPTSPERRREILAAFRAWKEPATAAQTAA